MRLQQHLRQLTRRQCLVIMKDTCDESGLQFFAERFIFYGIRFLHR